MHITQLGWDETIKLSFKSLIGNIVFFAALLLVITRFLTIWAGTPFPIDLVTSDSMSPALEEGDVVIWTPTTIDEIKKGDVVVFKSYVHWPEEKIVVHRVSDIKTDSKGNPILETKGDANEWTDQAGPHIPEPYIREDHVVGKTLNIGNQPIKIPFIGHIGLWVNQGIETLSQPSSSKESMSYTGIFTPLIISTVIFVVLIFLIPEKTRTIPEKIKKLIFGPKTINIKKTFTIFLVMYLAFFIIIHCFAFDTVSASLGINQKSQDSEINFGRIKPGKESFEKNLPVINPSISKVKGIIYAKNELNDYVSPQIFEIEKGEPQDIKINAAANTNSKNASYYGEIAVYSSPFWTIFSDEFIRNVLNWNTENAVLILDFCTALILTSLTVFLLALITFISKQYTIWTTNISWKRPLKNLIPSNKIKTIKEIKSIISSKISKNVGWIINTELTNSNTKEKKTAYIKPIMASSIIIPIMFILNDLIVATLVSSIAAAIIAYIICCKLRYKILLATIFTLLVGSIYLLIEKNMMIFLNETQFIKIAALGLGATGIYLLVAGLFILPLCLSGWFIVYLIRNLKERKNPLLMLDKNCDL